VGLFRDANACSPPAEGESPAGTLWQLRYLARAGGLAARAMKRRVQSRSQLVILRVMATKAERYRAEQQVSRSQAKPKKAKAHSIDRTVGPATAGVSGDGTALRNLSKRSNNKGGPALEISGKATPSRKSTRSSAGRNKAATELTRRQTRRITSPQARATRAAARG